MQNIVKRKEKNKKQAIKAHFIVRHNHFVRRSAYIHQRFLA